MGDPVVTGDSVVVEVSEPVTFTGRHPIEGPPATTLDVSEIFGPTIQGEGPFTGRVAVFLRLARCNLSCAYCDTPYTWDWTRFDRNAEIRKLTVADVVAAVYALIPSEAWGTWQTRPLLVITGGEPMLQQRALTELLLLMGGSCDVQIETNGTIAPRCEFTRYVNQFVVSPHLPSSAGVMKGAISVPLLAEYLDTGKAVLKFVIANAADIDDVAGLLLMLGRGLTRDRVWVMPEGTTPDAIAEGLRWLTPVTINHGWHLGTRLHVTIWGNERAH